MRARAHREGKGKKGKWALDRLLKIKRAPALSPGLPLEISSGLRFNDSGDDDDGRRYYLVTWPRGR